jgi:hypothetical protein
MNTDNTAAHLAPLLAICHRNLYKMHKVSWSPRVRAGSVRSSWRMPRDTHDETEPAPTRQMRRRRERDAIKSARRKRNGVHA